MSTTSASLKERLTEDMKAAMRARDAARLGAIRLALAAIKQREVDERITLDDSQVLAVLDKMTKQRRESIAQYETAGRQDLVDQERFELGVIQAYMPEALGETEIKAIIDAALAETGASSIKDMGKLMNIIRPKVQGRADLAHVSGLVKERLSA
ncbi:MAG: glutamyl-tRNA amidotransferase [Gammaproteobacteria bacterium RBG_16_57_12]|nr:MAG: glutamyl-tRNA amidotransferase [Gammaproteobacteria bacterium RBG_16_57_12]